MTGRVWLIVLGVMALGWMLNLARTGRLHVGYGVILGLVILAHMAAGLMPTQLDAWASCIGLRHSSDLLAAAGVIFLALLTIYLHTQVTILSRRVAVLTQELALRERTKSKTVAPDDQVDR